MSRQTKVIGLMPVRNEDWILNLSMRVALMWCDELIIFDHASTDGSVVIQLEVAAEHPGRVTLMGTGSPDDTVWNEMQHRQAMLEVARTREATHIAIIDADEVITANLVRSMNRIVTNMHADAILQLPLYNLRGSEWRYHGNGVWGSRIVSVAFRDEARAKWSGDQFHAREPLKPYRAYQAITQGNGGVLHFWGASERRLRAKHALYKVTERLRWPAKPVVNIDTMYSQAIYGRPGDAPRDWDYRLTPAGWLDLYKPWLHLVDLQAEPWQEAEVRRLMAPAPAGTFDGLDLFGVVACS